MAKSNKVEEVLREAAAAVEAAGLPDDLRSAGFAKAIELITGSESVPSAGADSGAGSAGKRKAAARTRANAGSAKTDDEQVVLPDAGTFYSELSRESGVPEKDLRDVLHVGSDGTVQVTQPTRKLGASISQQAKTTIALVAAARGIGLREDPVDAKKVRAEVKRKRCYQQKHYSDQHLGVLDGFNAGRSGEIILTSKWIDEFRPAVNRALGRSPAEEEKS